MRNSGCVIACDKSLAKIRQIAENAHRHALTIIHPFVQDGVQVPYPGNSVIFFAQNVL